MEQDFNNINNDNNTFDFGIPVAPPPFLEDDNQPLDLPIASDPLFEETKSNDNYNTVQPIDLPVADVPQVEEYQSVDLPIAEDITPVENNLEINNEFAQTEEPQVSVEPQSIDLPVADVPQEEEYQSVDLPIADDITPIENNLEINNKFVQTEEPQVSEEPQPIDLPVADFPQVEEYQSVDLPIADEITPVENNLEINNEFAQTEEPQVSVEPQPIDLPVADVPQEEEYQSVDLPIADEITPVENNLEINNEFVQTEEPQVSVEPQPIDLPVADVPQVEEYQSVDLPISDEITPVENNLEINNEFVQTEEPQVSVEPQPIDLPVADVPQVEEYQSVDLPISDEITPVENNLEINNEFAQTEEPQVSEELTSTYNNEEINSQIDSSIENTYEEYQIPEEYQTSTEYNTIEQNDTSDDVSNIADDNSSELDPIDLVKPMSMDEFNNQSDEVPQVTEEPEIKADESNGFTLDYNALYNVETPTIYDENGNVAIDSFGSQTTDENEDDLVSVAAPPSFDISSQEEVEEKPKEEEEVPINPEDLISMDIEEPDVLPVGKITTMDGKPIEDFGNPNELLDLNATVSDPIDDIYSQDKDIFYTVESEKQEKEKKKKLEEEEKKKKIAEEKKKKQQEKKKAEEAKKKALQQPAPSPTAQRPQQPVQGRGPQQGGPRPPQQRPVQGRGPQQGGPRPPQQRPVQGRGPQQGGPRPPQQRPVQGRGPQQGMLPNSKFINNDKESYVLPNKQPAYVQKPTDPNLVANPMAIFGNVSGLRPTSGEAINNPQYGYPQQGAPRPQQRPVQGRGPQQGGPRPPQQRPVQGRGPQQGGPRPPQQGGQTSTNKCPQCGFIVKPGQTSCLVCGYRLH